MEEYSIAKRIKLHTIKNCAEKFIATEYVFNNTSCYGWFFYYKERLSKKLFLVLTFLYSKFVITEKIKWPQLSHKLEELTNLIFKK